MARRNLHLLIAIGCICLVCYREAASRRSTPLMNTLVETIDKIETNYIEEVDRRQLFESALKGMMQELDPYSAYVSPDDYRSFRENLDQQFGGIGIQVTLDPGTKRLTVASPLVGTPAYEAGVLAGDMIVTIDGQNTEGFTLDDTVKMLRGEAGAPVVLGVLHKGSEAPVDLKMQRAIIQVETVLGDVRNEDDSWNFMLQDYPGIGYIRLTSFADQSVQELTEAIEWLEANGMQAMILDLRDNPGGLLTAATATCDLFIDEGIIVSTRGRDRRDRRSYSASPNGAHSDFPMVVLVNQYSASASEIVSACLQDHGRAVIIGQRTWGKGSVQNVIPLEGNRSALKLTTASYWRPNGKNIHRRKDDTEDDQWGVMPDEGFEVKIDQQQYIRRIEDRRRRDVVGEIPPPVVDDARIESPETDPGQDELVAENAAPLIDSTNPAAEEPSETGAESDSPAEANDADAPNAQDDAPRGPFVDEALRKAVEYLEQRLDAKPVRKAA
jgi:carboxyl-terminal processing protease